MHLTPRELDKLVLHQAGFLAQKRLARGVRLNHPEAVALIATQILEFIRDGRSVAERGNMELALYGSFLSRAAEPSHQAVADLDGRAGGVHTREGHLTLNEGREAVQLAVTNRGDRPIQVGSHYHFAETNRVLSFDRAIAYGMRLDIPAGTAVRFEPGETKTVALVGIAGHRVISGGNSFADGPVTEGGRARAAALMNRDRNDPA